MESTKTTIENKNLDWDKIDELVDQKFISKQKHPVLDLWILNYTQKTQWERNWTPETMACRGLIIDKDRNIVARPFPKFFNLGEILGQGGQIPAEDFTVTEKMDGSLGILYRDADNLLSLATRGSFISDQAKKGTQILREKYPLWNKYYIEWPKYMTFLFEILYPENRIVVDYGNNEELVLLAGIYNSNGEEVPYFALQQIGEGVDTPVVNRYDGITDFENLEQRPNSEGYVVHFPSSGQRFKVKFDEYVRLHKILTGVNKKTIWELLMNGDDLSILLEKVPDEFNDWVNETINELRAAYSKIEDIAKIEFEMAQTLVARDLEANPEDEPFARKSFALRATKMKYPSILFNILDGKPYDQVIWKMIKPVAEKPFKEEV